MRAGSDTPPTSPGRFVPRLLGLATCALALAGCSEADMVTQPKYKPLQPSTFFADGQSSRPIEPGTVARVARGETFQVHDAFETGETQGKLVNTIPLKGFDPGDKVDESEAREARRSALLRGRERFNIFCSPCHGRTGEGNGMIVQRGFSRPPSFHKQRLHDAPDGHFFRAITNGYGAMYSYASRVPPADRWAITAYIRALQMSRPAEPDDEPKGERSKGQGEGRAR